MSHRSDVVVIADTGITAQGMGAVVAALKKSHCIEVLDVKGLYWIYAYLPVRMVCILSIPGYVCIAFESRRVLFKCG